MRKVRGAAVVAAALVAAGSAHAMDYRFGLQAQVGYTPLMYRAVDPTDEQAAEAHTLEIDGNPAGTVGDQQVLDSRYAGAYQDGFALWGDGGTMRYWSPLFQATSNNGAFSFGARFVAKNKEHDSLGGNGWAVWLDWKQFEMKVGTTGSLGYGSYVRTGASMPTDTSALYRWEIEYKGVLSQHSTGQPDAGDASNYHWYGSGTSDAGSGVYNRTDKTKGFGLKWVQRVRGSDTLDVRLVNMFSQGYTDGRDYNALYPVGWNVQVNYRMPQLTCATTFKLQSNSETDWDEIADGFNLAWHIGAQTSAVPGVTLSAGYSLIGHNIGVEGAADDGVTYGKDWFGHTAEIAASFRLRDWSFNFSNTTSLILLSDYYKAVSNYGHYGWKPYLGEYVSLNASRRINGLMVGNIGLGFNDPNMNSYTDGKAEASIWFKPGVDISPARGATISIALDCSLSNFSDEAKGWWSRYAADAYSNTFNGVFYTYPHTFWVSIPITFTVNM